MGSKTLKDLELPIGSFMGCECGNHLVVDLKELKAEVIKHINDLERIKHFFNIEEIN